MSFLMDLPLQTPNPGLPQTQFTIKAKNLCYKLCSKKYGLMKWGGWWGGTGKDEEDYKYILKNVNCEANPGEITAIGGPSGAGKTTLLEILAGEIVPSRVIGEVLVNDKPMRSDKFRKLFSGYVTQDEVLFPLLTVEETLMYSARLRLHGGTKDEAKERVWKLLRELGLDHIARERVGDEANNRGISGGEKRRVSIGIELVHDPALLLIDEPTSGLDSASALHVMTLLKSMAKNEGKTILLTIHQPGYRILELIDRVVLLSNGYVLHNGPLHFLEERLKSCGHSIPPHVNVLEFAIDVSQILQINENDIENSQDMEKNASIIAKIEEEEEGAASYSINSPFKEVLILAQRFAKNVFRTKKLFASRAIQAFIAGILLGSIFANTYKKGERSSTLQCQMGFFAFSLSFLLSSTTEAITIFLQEKRILIRETSRGAYRISSYIIANTIVFLPFLLIVSLLFTSSVYWLVGLRQEIDGFLYFSLVSWMVISMSNSFVSCFIALFPDYITGMTVISGVMGGFFLFSGYFISKEQTPKYWIFMHYLSLFKYPFECFLINEFGGQNGRSRCVESIEGVCLLNADAFLTNLGLHESKKWINLLIMLFFILGYRFLCFLILSYRSYKTRN